MFMCLMNSIFSQYLDNFVVVFIDDILVYSKMKEEHDEHLRIVLQSLRKHKLYTKFYKCDFYQKEMQYLGHVILAEGIVVDSEKKKSIMEWIVPKDVENIWSFMGILDKKLLTSTPISKVADPDKDFIVCVDASKEGLGGVLTQEGHVICYES
jgi:hypothetical protein